MLGMNFDKYVWVRLFLALLVSASPLYVSASTGPSVPAIIGEMNADRQAYGLGTLRVDSQLSQAAQARSAYLAGQGRIFHVTAPAGTPWPNLTQAGYKYVSAGENLALGIETPEALEARWMASPTHRANILGSHYEDVGVGVTRGYYQGQPTSYVVVYFGKKRPEASFVATSPKSQTRSYSVGSSNATTQSVATASVNPPVTLGATSLVSSEKDTERVRLLKELISLLNSYLLGMEKRSGLI